MDNDLKKHVLRKMTYGMWVMTAAHESDAEASTVTWVSQMSFVPPLVAVGARQNSHLHEVVEKAGTFALHLVAEDKKEVAELFIKPTEVKDGPEGKTIAGYSYTPGISGSPLLDGFPCWLELKVVEIVKRGDHSIIVGEVVDVGQREDAKPLALAATGWHYGG
jgi:flavin reductase (DIM6/NTAB) family NADH-FMN oxidoreductase RutF